MYTYMSAQYRFADQKISVVKYNIFATCYLFISIPSHIVIWYYYWGRNITNTIIKCIYSMVAVTENESDICIHMHFLHFLATFDEIGQHTYICIQTSLENKLNSEYFSRSTPSFVWKILFLAQIFYTASWDPIKSKLGTKKKKKCPTKFRARAPSNFVVVKYSKCSRAGF
jgi:hypothetical protein